MKHLDNAVRHHIESEQDLVDSIVRRLRARKQKTGEIGYTLKKLRDLRDLDMEEVFDLAARYEQLGINWNPAGRAGPFGRFTPVLVLAEDEIESEVPDIPAAPRVKVVPGVAIVEPKAS